MRRQADEVVKVGWRTITRKFFINSDGTEYNFDTIGNIGEQAAAVIALTANNEVIIAEQFRFGPEQLMAELPGGAVDPGESPLEAVLRELREETGYTSEDIVDLGVAHDDGYSNLERHFFLARNCRLIGDQQLEAEEDIVVKLISVHELINNARTAKMSDALAVFYAYDELQKLL